ncbi:ubiquitin-like domain-containing protein [Cytobacillus sp. Hz8]|uniref:ubiquitin-like domain-containing protein n=1 Tax=Cytobacillus sp. Hz8 TaxID=3347168 RepID=UPI0035E340FE
MKNLFSKSLSRKKLAVFSASFVVLTTISGFVIYETTKKTVLLSIDGKEEVVKTHADTVAGIFDDLNISLHAKDYVYPSEGTKVKNQLKVEWKKAKQVQIVEDKEKKMIWTTASDVNEFLKEQSIALNKFDKVQPTLQSPLKNELKIVINHAFPVKLFNGRNKQQVWSTSTTVADFLSQQGIELKRIDRVEPNLNETIDKRDVVKVIRVEKVTDVVEEPVHYAVVTKRDQSLNQGAQRILKEGQKGLVSKEFEVTLENGKEISRKLIYKKTLREKQDKVVAVGSKPMIQMVSRGMRDASRELYVSTTAYTANCNGCSGKTATGINLRTNPNLKIIAVDPSVIPLGSKVYVDGYGYAVAADTGSAIKGNRIDVFFSSSSDAYRWGRKTVKIKILQ